MTLIDIGANLAHDSFDRDRDAVLERAAAAGVGTLVVTGSCKASSERAAKLAAQHPGHLYATAGIHPHHVGRIPTALAALCRGMADMQTLASDAYLEKDLRKAFEACLIDPATAASATPARIRRCFEELLEAERPWLEPDWGAALTL